MRYHDRAEGGTVLAEVLVASDPEAASTGVVLGVPRGGVIVAASLSAQLGLQLDIALARKLGAPFNPELAVGAVAEGGAIWLNDDLLERIGGRGPWLDEVIAAESAELSRRAARYRPGPPVPVEGRTAIVVDDGVATGATLAAVLQTLRGRDPERLVCAVPVAPPEGVTLLARHCDLVVCPLQPRRFSAVGSWYDDFRQTSDDEVIAALAAARD